MEHHVWCNQLTHSIQKDGTCRMCQGLYLAYPDSGHLDHVALQEKYFPDAIPRPGTGPKTA